MGVLRSSTTCDIDFDKKGRQVSVVRLGYSDNRHAYGMIPIPIAVIANGEGPTVFLAAGTHGDEYEGQVILRRMIHNLDPASVSGRLIIMPALNYPAVLASARISPLDDGNLARVFPGEEGASPTLSIAHFVDSKILPLCDALMDLHSGGRAADMIPQTYLCKGSDPALNARRLELLDVFAAPLTVIAGEEASPGYLDYSAAERYGIASFSTELGGGGGVDLDGLAVGTNGVNRVLHHLGVIPADPSDTKIQNSRLVTYGSGPYASVNGLFEPYCVMGEEVKAGQVAGCIHPQDDPGRQPVEPKFPTDGLIVGCRVPAIVKAGDFLFSVAADIARDDIL